MKPELDENLRRLRAPIVGGAKLFRVTPSRLAIGYIALGVLALAILAIPLWYGWKVNLSTLKVYVEDRDVRELVHAFDKGGAPGLAAAVDARARSLSRDEVLILADASKHRLAGNLPAWPPEVPDAPGTYGLGISLGDGSSMRVVATHVALPDGHRLLAGRESIRFESLVDLFWYDIAAATVLVLALGVVAGWLIRRALLSEVQEVGRTAAAIASGDHSRRVPTHGRSDALGTLARTVNDMLDQLASQNVRLENAHDELEGLVAQRTLALADSEARFRSLTEISSDFFWETDAEHRYSSIEFGEAYAGKRDPSFRLGRARWEIPSPSPDEAGWAAHRAAHAARERFLDFGFSRMENGEERFYEISGEPRFDARGGFLGYRGVGRDVTERKRAELALRRSEQYLAEAQRLSHSGVAAYNETAILYGSEEIYRIWGFDPAQGVPSREAVFRLIHPEDRGRLLAEVQRAVGEKRGYSTGYRIVLPDGTTKHLEVIGQPVFSASGELVEIVTTQMDVTEQKRAELALRKSEERYARAMEASGDGHADWNIETGEFYVSPRYLEICGLPRDTTFRDRAEWVQAFPFHPEDRAKWEAAVAAHFASQGTRFREEMRIVVRGETRWLEVTYVCRRDAAGRPIRWTSASSDITARKCAEQELQRSQRYLAEAQKVGHTGSWAWSPVSNTLLYWSEECYRILGYDPAQGLPSFESTFERIHPEDRPALTETIERALREKTEFQIEYRLLLPDSTQRNVRILSQPVLDASGKLVEFVGTVMDVTEQKRARQQRRAHLWFLENMDRINRAMQRSNDVELMTSGVMQEALEIFACDRACLIYPCDPDAPTYRTVMEHTSPDYGGALSLGQDLVVTPEWGEAVRRVLHHPEAMVDPSVSPATRERYRVASMLAIAVRPKGDRPYLLAVHSARSRPWTAAEVRLFEETARRLGDALTSVLAHRNLLASEERYGLAMEASEEGHFDTDIETGRTFVSARLNEIYGFSRAAEIADRVEFLNRIPLHPDDRHVLADVIKPDWDDAARDAYTFECRIVPRAGEVRWIHTRGMMMRDAEGRARRRVGVVADITERKRAEDALRASEGRYSLAMEAADEGHYDLNIDTGELFISERLNEIYGFAPGTRFANRGEYLDKLRLYPDDVDNYHAELAAAVADGGPERYEFGFRIVHPSGEARSLWTRGKVTRDAEGRAHRRTGVIADITEQKQAEEERRVHVWFLESMDRINRAMQRGNDVELMTSGVMQEALEIFACDRAALIYPCDPDAPTFRTVMEHTSPEYGGARSLGRDLPATPEWGEAVRLVLHHPGAVVDPSVSAGRRERYRIASTLAIAVRPKGDRPYLFAVHSVRSRPWTAAERRLFEEIARRLEDALTSMLAHRNLLASEEELRTSEQRFRTFVDHATDAFYLYDDEHVVRDVNRQACETTGYTREELIGMHVSQLQLSTSATPEAIASTWRRLVERGTETYNGLRRRKDGSVFPVEIRARTFNRGGRTFALVVAIDITERKRREQCLLAQFHVTQTLSVASSLEEAAPGILRAMCEALEWGLGAFWQVDPEGGVLRCIATWPSASAAPPDFAAATRAITFGPGMGLPGRVWSSGGPVWIRDVALDPELPRAKSAAKEGLHAAFAFPLMLKSGIVGVIELFSREARDADRGLLQMMAAIGSQVAQFMERMRGKDALRDAREKLAQASKIASLAELSASIAHEINQPLQAIVANGHASLRWLDATPPNIEKAIRTAKRVVRDGNAAADVVSRIRALFEHAAPAKVDLDINKLILQVRTLMADEIQGNGVSLETELGEDVPTIRADAVQIQQVIVNLVRNAIEAMAGAPRKPLLIRSRRSASHVVVDVRDQGTGVLDAEKIFEPFVSTKQTGMGMGLTICRSIIEAHAGDIRVVHNEGPGVTFSFSLPLEASDAT